jgi:hypothetical protein
MRTMNEEKKSDIEKLMYIDKFLKNGDGDKTIATDYIQQIRVSLDNLAERCRRDGMPVIPTE